MSTFPDSSGTPVAAAGTTGSVPPGPQASGADSVPVSPMNSVKMGLAAATATVVTALAVFGPHLNTAQNLDTINGCGLSGRATNAMQVSLNPLKNRYSFPEPADVATNVDLKAMLGATSGQLDSKRAASVEGYITRVKQGGIESCNCGTTDSSFMDTHIYVNESPQFDEKHAVIVEVTPRLREEMQGSADWSTTTLIRMLRPGTKARITGWLFYDAEHENASENIHPGAAHNWRGTCWELHPVTAIESETAEQDALPPGR